MYEAQRTSKSREYWVTLLSPFVIITTNYITAYALGPVMSKWVFVPIIVIEWCLYVFFLIRCGDQSSVQRWLRKPDRVSIWTVLALTAGMIPLPIFLLHYKLLACWKIGLPWIVLATINPWLEEFYWRGLLLDHTRGWNRSVAVLFQSVLFAANHAVFGLHSQLLHGPAILVSTLVMGLIWGIAYQKTSTLRWVLLAHFLVDFLSLSVPSFLDLYTSRS